MGPTRFDHFRTMLAGSRVLLPVAVAAAGCTRDIPPRGDDPTVEVIPPAARAVQDDLGRAVVLPGPAGRVVSFIPSMTDLVVALDGRASLVARTRYDRGPEVVHLPSLGNTDHANLEAVAALRPDLVISWAEPVQGVTGGRMSALGIPTYHASVRTLDDLRRHARKLGFLLDRCDAADRLLASLDARLDAVRESVPPGPGPSVLYLVWHDPPQTAGSGTFLDSLIVLAGGRNVFHDAAGPWPRVSLEEILRRDPDRIVVGGEDGAESSLHWLRAAGWRELSAVREGRVLQVSADLFNRPGPRIAEAAEELAAFLRSVPEDR